MFVTSFYGGWHFTDILLQNYKEASLYFLVHFGFTLLFSGFIVFIDCLVLNSGKQKAILWVRFGLVFLLSGFIAVLTTLNICSGTITAELNRVTNNDLDSRISSSAVTNNINTLKNIIDLRDADIKQKQEIADTERMFGINGRPAGKDSQWQQDTTEIGELKRIQIIDRQTLDSLEITVQVQ